MGLKEKIGLGDPPALTAQAREEAPQFEHITWYKDPGARKLFFYSCVLCFSSMGTGYDGMYFNNVQIFESWQKQFDRPDSHLLGLLGAFYQIGAVCSIPLVPIICDRWGRRLSIAVGFIIMAIGAAVQAAANTYGVFGGARVILGFGNSFAQIASPMLLTEISHPQHRARFTTVYNCLWNGGAIIVNWFCFGLTFADEGQWQWRLPAIFQGVPGLVQLVILWWIPESPRFLIAQDRHDEALSILAKYHANGNADHPTVQFEFREIRDTIKLEQLAKKSSSYLDFFRTKGNRYRLQVLIALGLFSQWSGNAIISNYSNRLYRNAGITNETSISGLNAGNTVMATITSISFALLSERVNRRFCFLLATGGMFICLVFWTLTSALHEQHQASGAQIGMIFLIWLFGFFYATAWSGLLIGYGVELLPYTLRAKGLMILNMSIQVALLLNTYLNPLAFKAWEAPRDENGDESTTGYGGTVYYLYLIYTIWVGFELTYIYFMFVETRGPTLEELVKIIDGPDAKVADIDIGTIAKDTELHEDSGLHHRANSTEKTTTTDAAQRV